MDRWTFEHVPSGSAFDDSRVIYADIEKVFAANRLLRPIDAKAYDQQRGAGKFTLCNSCNSKTGSWYVPEYTALVKRAYGLARPLKPYEACYFAIELKPLRFLKAGSYDVL